MAFFGSPRTGTGSYLRVIGLPRTGTGSYLKIMGLPRTRTTGTGKTMGLTRTKRTTNLTGLNSPYQYITRKFCMSAISE